MDKKRTSLAINGGSKVRTKEWPANNTCGLDEIFASIKVIRSGYLSKFEGSLAADPPFDYFGGPFVKELESKWGQLYNTKFAVSLNSATSGIFAALGAFNLGVGDEVIVPAATMSAVAITPLYWNCIPIFADLDKETGTICPIDLEKKITEKTKAIIVVHQFGTPADMDKILKIAKNRNLKVIEDCAQAHLTEYKGKKVGSLGDIGVFSLNVNKSIQVGEGAVCITNNKSYFHKMALIRNHGENASEGLEVDQAINTIGQNLRMTELHAALSLTQLKKVHSLTNKRLALVDYFIENIKSIKGIRTYAKKENCFNTFYQFPLFLESHKVDEVLEILNAEGGYFIKFTKPLYHLPVFKKKECFKHGMPWSHELARDVSYDQECPNAEYLHDHLLINEFVRPPCSKKDIDDLIKILKKVFS